jgi:hypothetical protein
MTDPQTPLAVPTESVPDPLPPAAAPLGMTAEWPEKAVDAIDSVIAAINDRAIRPIVVAARAIVFGLIVAVVTTVVLVLGSITLIRLLDVYVMRGRVWAAYALLGIVLTAGGLGAYALRTPRRSPSAPR